MYITPFVHVHAILTAKVLTNDKGVKNKTQPMRANHLIGCYEQWVYVDNGIYSSNGI